MIFLLILWANVGGMLKIEQSKIFPNTIKTFCVENQKKHSVLILGKKHSVLKNVLKYGVRKKTFCVKFA